MWCALSHEFERGCFESQGMRCSGGAVVMGIGGGVHRRRPAARRVQIVRDVDSSFSQAMQALETPATAHAGYRRVLLLAPSAYMFARRVCDR